MYRVRGVLLLAVVIALCLTPGVMAQNVTGTISGVITDATAAVVPTVSVTVVNQGTNAAYTGTSDSLGAYSIRSLPIGVYDLTAENPGFKRFEATGIRLQVNEIARVDPVLEVGDVTETVEVAADVITVDTVTTTLKTVIDERRISDLPLNGRDPVQLMRLVAGVQLYQGTGVTSGTTYPGVVSVSVNGSRGNATNYILDGGQNNDHYSAAPNPMPNPDALAEFSVQTNNFSAEYGRSSGGIVNAVTKSGTNDFHGSGFGYLRNNALNAASFFAPPKAGSPNEKQDDGLKRTQYGATAGGPVVKDKVFFFGSYQGTRVRRRPTSAGRQVFSSPERQGNFSALSSQLKDPLGGVFTNNQIPQSRFHPATSAVLLDNMPAPTIGEREVVVTNLANLDDDQYMAKADYQVTDNNRFTGRFFLSEALRPGNLNQSNFYEHTTGRTWRNTSVVFTNSHIFGATMINSTTFGFNRTNGFNFQELPERSWADLGVDISQDEFPQYHISFDSISNINTGDSNNFLRDEYQFSNTLRWTKGSHQISMGGEWGRGIGDIVNNFRGNGRFRYRNGAGYTGVDRADFIIGFYERLQQGLGEFKETRFDRFALFFQDSMKLTSRFTLDVGMRWDPFFPYTDKLGKLSTWRPGQQSTRFVNAPEGVLYPGDPGIPDGGFDTGWGNFGPRIGFAWDLTGDGKTSLRAGYGIFYDQTNTISTNSQANQGPFGTLVELFGNPSNLNQNMTTPFAGFEGGNPFPAVGFSAVGTDLLDPPGDVTFLSPHTAFVYDADMRNAYNQAWNLTLEREVFGGFVARASYAASKGTALVSGRDVNAPLADATASTSTTNTRRPLNPTYNRVTLIQGVGNSIYHSGQFTLEKRFSRGYTILANYTVAKVIDDNRGSANKATGTSVTNPLDQSFDRGPADYDHRHVFNFSSLWEIPGSFDSPVANGILGGWNLSTIVGLQSGSPFTVLSGRDNARTGQGSQRADLTGENPDFGSRSRGAEIAEWLNKGAFTGNALGTYGVLGRNTFYGPGRAVLDLGIHKNFSITERLRSQFRFEIFNALNRPNFDQPETRASRSSFMRITRLLDGGGDDRGNPRILQFALRFDW